MSDDDFPHDDFPKLDDELLKREHNNEDNPYFIIEHILACREKGDKYWEEWHDWYIDDLLRGFFKEDDKKSNYNKFGIYSPNESRTGDIYRWREYHRAAQMKRVMSRVRGGMIQDGVKLTGEGGIAETLAKHFGLGERTTEKEVVVPPKRTSLENRKIKRTLIKKQKAGKK